MMYWNINEASSSSSSLPGGATNLNDLSDVVISTPQANQVLKYDGATFINSEVPGLADIQAQFNNLNASNITTGILDSARLPSLYFSGTESVAPYVSAITPAITSSGSQNITITGDNFTPNTTVTIPGATITNLVVCSPQKITLTINKQNLLGLITITISNGANNNQVWSEGIKNLTINSDPFSTNVVLFIKADGSNNSTNIIDSSPTPKTISRFGDTKISTIQSKYGGSSLLFDGAGDYLSIPSSNDWNLATGDFTIEGWINFSAFSSSNTGLFGACLLATHSSANTAGWQIRINGTASSYTTLNIYTGSQDINYNAGNLALNTWHHIAVSRQGNTLRGFVNGALVGTTTQSGAFTTGILSVGFLNVSGYFFYLNGYLDSLRITKGVARYSASFNIENDTYLNT